MITRKKATQIIKKNIYELLESLGETADNIYNENIIIVKGIKITKKRNNGGYFYVLEDTSLFDNYFEIDNLFILKAILEKIKNDSERIKTLKEIKK
jgi:predicted ATP-grasp superfamily ATP-dependent carboligase